MSECVTEDTTVIIKGYKPLLYLSENEVIAYTRGRLCVINPDNQEVKQICKIPMRHILRVAANLRCVERTLRLTPRALEMIDKTKCVFVYKGVAYLYDLRNNSIQKEFDFHGIMSSPLNMTRIAGNATFGDGVYCGQYTDNIEKESVKIWRRPLESDQWETAYEFPKGQIHHVHNIIPDKNNEFVYILTGDDDTGSGIWRAYKDFSVVEPLLIGSQEYRACVLFEMGNKVIYCTDTPMMQNYICCCRMEGNKLVVEEKHKIPGSVIYGDSNGREIMVSTSVEPNSIFEDCGFFEKYFEKNLGDGIQDDYVHIIKGNFDDGFSEIDKERKDRLPMRLCQFGSAQFPRYALSKFGVMSISFEATVNDNDWVVMGE